MIMINIFNYCERFRVMAKGDGLEVGFQDGGYFSRFLKRE